MSSTRTSDERITTAITAKLTAGTLPSTAADRTWGSPGSGRPCAGCDESIDRRDLEIEMVMPAGRMLVLHVECFMDWFDLTRAARARQAT